MSIEGSPTKNGQTPGNLVIDDVVATFGRVYDTRPQGPQVEGLSPQEVIAAVRSDNSVWLDTAYGKLPLFTPIENNSEYNQTYFQRFIARRQQPYFFSHRLFEGIQNDSFQHALKRLIGERALVVTDFETQDVDTIDAFEDMLSQHGVSYSKDQFMDPRNNSPAAVQHYAGKAFVNNEIFGTVTEPVEGATHAFERLKERFPDKYNYENGVALVVPEEINDEFIEDVWHMYQAQFTQLIAENPSMQAQIKDDLEKTIRSDSSMILVSFDDGKPVSLCYFVSDIHNVYWLRPEFYSDRFRGEHTWYFPGIVTKPGYEGKARAAELTDLGTRIAYERQIEPVITFQCTNISKDYVPKLVKAAIEGTGLYTIGLDKIAEYRYVGYSLESDGVIE